MRSWSLSRLRSQGRGEARRGAPRRDAELARHGPRAALVVAGEHVHADAARSQRAHRNVSLRRVVVTIVAMALWRKGAVAMAIIGKRADSPATSA